MVTTESIRSSIVSKFFKVPNQNETNRDEVCQRQNKSKQLANGARNGWTQKKHEGKLFAVSIFNRCVLYNMGIKDIYS